MYQIEITLTSGAQTVVDVEDFTILRRKISRQIVDVIWTNPEGVVRRLLSVDPDQIAMVVEINPDRGHHPERHCPHGGTHPPSDCPGVVS